MTETQVDGSGIRRRARTGAEEAPPAAGGRAAARKGRKKPKRRGLRILAYTTAGLVLLTAGVGGYLYVQLSGNIKSSPLFGGTSGDAGHETPDAFGRTPINVLVIGSDTRDNAADCAIGGVCGAGANADVEMVLHVAADRSNATVMSIPRDLMTNLPACTDTVHHTSMKAQRGQINSTLDYGPGCTVAAVHQLTNIPIDHFITVDFTGVVQMSDAVGGVPICVSDNVYDPDSHLKLKKGQHTLKGMAALQFVRTRHGFGDGSDTGRTVTQHMFLGAMVRQLKSAGTISDPGALLSLAEAATKALTVDDSLKSIPKLAGLAQDLNKVPPSRITFATMQNYDDNLKGEEGRVLLSPAAHKLFDTITNDQSLTTSTGDKSSAAAQATSTATDSGAAPASAPAAAPTPAAPAPAADTVPKKDITVHVKNASGATGRAGELATALKAAGYNPATAATNATANSAKSLVEYAPGKQAEATEVAASVGLPATAVQPGTGTGVTLVIGADWTSGTTFTPGTGGAGAGAATTAPAPVDTHAALSDTNAATADDNSKCAQVSTARTLTHEWSSMTPSQAYAKATNVPDSAP